MRERKVFVIGGGGMVGATAAQVIAIKEIVSEVVLIDIAEELVHGQAMDINHATAYTNGVQVRVGDYGDIHEDDIVVITCGAAQDPQRKHRLDLLEVNTKIVQDVVGKVMAQGKPVFIVMVTNPVDALTYVALKASGLPKERVLGTGTTLDTARLRVTLANALHVSQQEVQAYVLGEHGHSSLAALSSATIGGVPLQQFPGFTPQLVATIDEDIRQAAYKIIAAKKATYYGIGSVVATVVEALVRTTGSVLSVCSLAQGEYGLDNVVVGLPTLVSNKGVAIVDHYPLSDTETQQLHHSATAVAQAIGSI
ncbi:MAG TPA: L-lactate dehydrogenase [Nevskiaceae bacterium]|nr:L-lactate dehydrogenase [Nevskiaceae bacterium]